MFKIKDDINLKELEQHGFEDLGVCYKKYCFGGLQYFINKGTREIKRLHPYSFREELVPGEIENLGIKDLVEKVEEK